MLQSPLSVNSDLPPARSTALRLEEPRTASPEAIARGSDPSSDRSAEPRRVRPSRSDALIDAIAAAISGAIDAARLRGQSLEELKAEVLADDRLLDANLRRWLSNLVAETWARSEAGAVEDAPR